jgi:hypothetical protein
MCGQGMLLTPAAELNRVEYRCCIPFSLSTDVYLVERQRARLNKRILLLLL